MNRGKEYDSLYVQRDTRISYYMGEALKHFSYEKCLPMSRLIAIALDHELERPNPFDYPLDLPPTGTFEEYSFTDEGGKILEYFKKIKSGIPLDLLTLRRHDAGIENKETFLAAFKEILDANLLVTFKPRVPKFSFPYAADYVYYSLRIDDERFKKKNIRKEKENDRFSALYKKIKKDGDS